jgi:hypothetical protein
VHTQLRLHAVLIVHILRFLFFCSHSSVLILLFIFFGRFPTSRKISLRKNKYDRSMNNYMDFF